ncbi:MAG: T9SS type A sorting domain-containing protein [Bacteroidetes bacterium]|nr:T9SS type A sorting domain-containing protein [Bacteroidota bacterium]
MKNRNILFTISFLFLAFNSFSQVNGYFLNNPKWQVKGRYYDGTGWSGNSDEFNYTVVGDTVINFLTYKKIKKNGVFTNIGIAGETLSSSSYVEIGYSALLRSVGKKMYYFGGGVDSTSDVLMYDYNLNVGDTVPQSINSVYNGSPILTVTAIDSFYTSAGYRMRFHLGAGHYLYEGVGTIGGLLENIFGTPSVESTSTLLCFSLNDSSYVPSMGLSCNVLTGIVEQSFDESVLVYPNPFSDRTTIELVGKCEKGTIIITDVVGRAIEMVPFVGNKLEFDRGDLKAGIYFIQIISNNSILACEKIIIQ